MAQSFIRKTWISVAGATVILAGIAMLVLPGPGLVTIAAGLAILATEFEWAQRLVEPLKTKLREAATRLRETTKRPPKGDA